jgi:YHS domain-containing protein
MGLIRLLLYALVGFAAYLLFRRVADNPRRPLRDAHEGDDRLGRLVQDPQCGVYVDSREAVRRKVPDGQLFFCSKRCADAYFEKARQQG